MSKAYLLNALVAYSILGGLSAKLWRAASPLFIFAIRYRNHKIIWSRSRMDTTNASGALDPRSIRGGTTWQRRQTKKY